MGNEVFLLKLERESRYVESDYTPTDEDYLAMLADSYGEMREDLPSDEEIDAMYESYCRDHPEEVPF